MKQINISIAPNAAAFDPNGRKGKVRKYCENCQTTYYITPPQCSSGG